MFIRRPLAIAALSAALAACCSLARADDRPNILFIFSDDHGWQTIGAYGSNRNETPHLDRIADEGMRFDNCSVTNSICAPSRATILTGTHNHINGNICNERLFDRDQATFPPMLQRAGYQTAMIGKYHLRTEPSGFDHYDILINQGRYYNPPMVRNGARVNREGYTTDVITDLAIDWLRDDRDEDKPFLLMVQHKSPHRQWEPGPDHLTLFDGEDLPEPPTLFDDFEGRSSAHMHSAMSIAEHLNRGDLHLDTPSWMFTPEQEKLWESVYGPKNEAFREAKLHGDDLVRWKYQRFAKDYLRCVQSIDDGVGRILDELDRSGLADNTIVVYTSDQGWYLGEHGWYDKRWMYEESFRTPLLVRWPGVTPKGSVCDELVQNLDFAQTFLDVAGVEPIDRMQGQSIVPLLKGETPEDWRESVYYRFYENRGPHKVPRHEGVATKRFKLINFYGLGEWEMYDLDADPDELASVYDDPAYSEDRDRLAAELDRLRDHYEVTAAADEEYERHEDALESRRAFNRLLGKRPGRWGVEVARVASENLDDVERERVAYTVGGRDVEAFVYRPSGSADELHPGVLLLHPEAAGSKGYTVGKSEVEDVALTLAREGYVVLSPDRIGYESRAPERAADRAAIDRYRETLSKRLIAEGSCLLGVEMSELEVALEYLMTRDDVNEKRIAAIGPREGGTLATFLGFLSEDVTVVATALATMDIEGALDKGGAPLPLIAPGLLAMGGMETALKGVYPRPLLEFTTDPFAIDVHKRVGERYDAGGRGANHEVVDIKSGEVDVDGSVVDWLNRWLVEPFEPQNAAKW